MRLYAAFDDTDTLDCGRGTGKLVRWFGDDLPSGCTLWGVVRQQLLVHPDVPYTSHNSSAVAVIDTDSLDVNDVRDQLVERGIAHLAKHWFEGSDPGLCVVVDGDPALDRLAAFGQRASIEVVTQADAFAAAEGAHLSGHGGTNDGVIGAAAGVGLTWWGWSGRFVEYKGLRDFAAEVTVAKLQDAGMYVLPVNRNVVFPKPTDRVRTGDWLRPVLWGGRPCVPVSLLETGVWGAIGKQPIQL